MERLSVVITTRNEAANIANCIHAFDGRGVEVIVVDNGSTDATKAIASSLGAQVFDFGPERSAQRNFGWRHAKGEWVLILDADMILPPSTLDEIEELLDNSPIRQFENSKISSYWLPEVRTGSGLRVKARNFERSFYNGTAIDALRLFKREVLETTGGYDENLIAGPEDWELDIRVLQAGYQCAVLKNHLIHNERALTFRRMLEKKAYYSKSMAAYQAKWRGHPALQKQFGFYYRFFGVFVENGKWRKLLRHPLLTAVMYFERIAVGFVYLLNRR